jgi:DNA-directed RNA polymerase specialized sigma24 family protein
LRPSARRTGIRFYAYVRRRGYDSEDARDLTQGFFTGLLAKHEPLRPSREQGRFRSYLFGALKHYLANEWDRERAGKRGGGQSLLRLDFENGEDRYRLEPADSRTPETLYERRWALTVLEIVL